MKERRREAESGAVLELAAIKLAEEQCEPVWTLDNPSKRQKLTSRTSSTLYQPQGLLGTNTHLLEQKVCWVRKGHSVGTFCDT